MRAGMLMKTFVSLALALSLAGLAAGQQQAPLVLKARIPLTGVHGRIDHFSVDLQGGRIFLSALGNGTVEVLDARAAKRLKTLSGLAEPQGVLYEPESHRIVVACGGDGAVKFYDGATYRLLATSRLGDDADNVREDNQSHHVVVGYGEGALALFQPSGDKIAEIALDGHPESFQMDPRSSRVFINVPTRQAIEVADLNTHRVVARWPQRNESANFPMALDATQHRLLVGFRSPARLVAIDADSGRAVATTEIVDDTDDVYHDAARRRAYVIGGGGFVDVIAQSDADHYRRVARIRTAPGARTGLFVPQWQELFVAVPHRGAQAAEVLVFHVE